VGVMDSCVFLLCVHIGGDGPTRYVLGWW